MPGYDLTYVALVARDVDQTIRFLGDSLDLPRLDLARDDIGDVPL
ncbi:MAG: hypothetical protein ACR2PI_08210 [Hyphomicrobiaceae bacterium]